LSLLADLTAYLHGAVVVYLLGGLLVILAGLWRGWAVAKAFWFRFTHLCCWLVVTAFAIVGQPCPLTTLEQYFRELADPSGAYQGSFLAYQVHRAIHLQLSEFHQQVLAGLTVALFAAVAALYFWRGPRGQRKCR